MRIVIDMQGAQSESRFRGIGRYSLSLALAIARNAGEHEIWLALNGAFPDTILDIRQAFEELIPQEHIRIFEVPLPVAEHHPENQKRARVSELIREYFLEQLNPDVILVTSLFEGYLDNAVTSVGQFSSGQNTAVILYDLIPYLNQKKYLPSKDQYNYYMRKITSLNNAGLLLSISESSRQEGFQALNIDKAKIQNISTAVDENFCDLSLTAAQVQMLHDKYNIKRKMLMYAPGGFDVRKNFEGLIQAYGVLPKKLRREHQLVIVSKIQEGDRYKLINLAKKAGLDNDELVLTGYVSNEDLIALYNTATLFIFPSKHEGFGLPALEAMACGAPAIGSNTTSIPEVIGWEEALFDPDSIESIAQKIEQVLTDDDFMEKLKQHSIAQSKLFLWDTSAKLALDSMNNLYSNYSSQIVRNEDIIQSIAKTPAATELANRDLVLISSSLAFNSSSFDSKQLLIDISEIVKGDAKSGIQRVVRSILMEILCNSPKGYEVKPIYFDGEYYRYASTFIANFLNTPKSDTIDEVVGFQQDDIYLALDLNAHLTHAVHELHKNLQRRGIRLYFIIYDLLLVQRPDWWPKGTSLVFKEWLKSITEVSTGLICISEAVANEVRAWMEKNPSNYPFVPEVMSFHLGADVNNSLPSKGLPDNYKFVLSKLISKPSFLMVGTIEPRKGHMQTLEAFEKLWQDELDIILVIIGKEGWLVDDLVKKLKNHPQLNKQLFWLDGISDEYLEQVYRASTCLIAASEGEGFGLPLIEAAQHEIPIIARDIPVFKEVAGEFAYYFENDKTPDVIAASVKNWLMLYEKEAHPTSLNMPWLTWKESSEQLLTHIIKGK